MYSQDDDEFLRSIPPFLRRTDKLPRRKLAVRPRDAAPSSPSPKQDSAVARPQEAAKSVSAPRSPSAPKNSGVKAKAAPRPVTKPVGDAVAGQRARIALAFRNESLGDGSGDVAFQVTLPRSVVTQIRGLAEEKETSQRAIVLRALRLAGVSIPDGSDLNHSQESAKRRQQA